MPAKGQKQPRLCRDCGETNPQKFQARLATLCGKCRQARYKNCIKKCTIRTREQEKLAALTRYGLNGTMQCSWENCSVTDPDMLALDHIANNGAAERRTGLGKSHDLYHRLKMIDYPTGYQTLCHNHNQKKQLLLYRSASELKF